ncbi:MULTISPECIES: hypothetical protein [unclassified Dysgonomonas]|jgi:hypothetical protein|uniref:hypothetical protein n=1 Tax=unclassified Dysgonomonas TaxID=2630389 RepID=UPI0025B99D2D|nr:MULTISPECIES: hypothetical protein [unclassified Dysgonomonas]MDR2003714.1 hypothetical protein [Prevotella sp.]HMM01546.1 hypothetical protein [Dysgonomonas sp.]
MKAKIQKVILLLFILTPLFCLSEIFEYLGLGLSFDMFFIKLPKDILMIFLLLMCTIFSFRYKHPHNYYICLLLLFSFTIICFAFSYSLNGLQIAMAGVRWAIPFFLLILLYDVVDIDLLKKVTKILFCLLILHAAVQLLEMLFFPPRKGLNIFGFPGRLPGIFVHPSASGTFAAFCFYVIRYFQEGKIRLLGLVIAILSVFLSMSSTGVMLLFLLIFMPWYLKSKHKGILSIIAVLFLFLVVTNLDFLTGRGEGSSAVSGGTRIQILQEIVDSAEPISTNFGLATNTAINLMSSFGIQSNAYIADSLYTSVLTNYGVIFFFLFISAILYLLLYLFVRKKIDIPFVLIFLISITSGVSIIIVEMFPMNIIIAVFLSYFMKEYSFISKNK